MHCAYVRVESLLPLIIHLFPLISDGRTSLNMAWVPGAAVWLTARHSGKIGNGKCVRVCVCRACEIVQACVWIIAQQLCAMQWINVALCQATANISLPLSCFLTLFFPSPSFSFCLTPTIHLSVKYDSVFYIFYNLPSCLKKVFLKIQISSGWCDEGLSLQQGD